MVNGFICEQTMAAVAAAWGGPSLYDEAADLEVRQGRTLKTLWTEVAKPLYPL